MIDPLAVYTSCRLRDSYGSVVPYGSAWWRGAPVNWRIAIYNADGTLNNLTGITKISLTITNMINGGAGRKVWLFREYPAPFNPGLTPDQWGDKSNWHFEAALSGDDTLMTVTGAESNYWAALEAIGANGDPIPLAALQIRLRSARGATLDRDAIGYIGTLTYGGPPLTYN